MLHDFIVFSHLAYKHFSQPNSKKIIMFLDVKFLLPCVIGMETQFMGRLIRFVLLGLILVIHHSFSFPFISLYG